LELLGRLIGQSATARVLFVATARPEFTPPWPARSNLTTVQLARLTKRQAREVVTRILEGAGPSAPNAQSAWRPSGSRGADGAAPSISDTVLDTLVARADGVPLYLEELTK